jgi:hypothetical protein
MNGFNEANSEYEYHLTHPYDKGGALYEEEINEEDYDAAYWQKVDAQIDDYKMEAKNGNNRL